MHARNRECTRMLAGNNRSASQAKLALSRQQSIHTLLEIGTRKMLAGKKKFEVGTRKMLAGKKIFVLGTRKMLAGDFFLEVGTC